MRGIMSEIDGFDHLCLDLVHAKQLLTDDLDPRVSHMRAQKDRYASLTLTINTVHRIEKNLISQIERSKGEVNRLGNMLRSEMLMKEAQ